MTDNKNISEAKEMLEGSIKTLARILLNAETTGDYSGGLERFWRWRERTERNIREKITPREADKFNPKYAPVVGYGSDELNLAKYAERKIVFLETLLEDIEENPTDYFGAKRKTEETKGGMKISKRTSRIVFIVHGHDEGNLLRLKDVLTDRWGLEVKLLRKRPQKSRAVLDKFEQEAEGAAFAFALFTPDDKVGEQEGEYQQPRPNVFFELGWLYGKIGRDNVCIIRKDGAKVPSDLEGIARIDFKEYVNEKIEEIETELKEVGLIK